MKYAGFQQGTVKDMPYFDQFQFISDSQGVGEIDRHFSLTGEFDSFFVSIFEGDFVQVFGMHGIIPTLDKPVYKICSI